MNSIKIECSDEPATLQLAETLALALKRGDLVTLRGTLGAGKTTLARALIRIASGDPLTEVPSPTFTLVQSYGDLPFGALAHMDLYRLEDSSELEELGLDEALQDGAVLLEWPEKAGSSLPEAALEVAIEQGKADDARRISISGTEGALGRLRRSLTIREFLDRSGHAESTRQHLTGDASTRAYETITPQTGEPVILMNAPAVPDGPPVKDGKPYSQIARLAEDMRAFVGVSLALEKGGFTTPKIFAHDLDEGLLLIENLGAGLIIDENREPIAERYHAAVEMLVALHNKSWLNTCPLPDGTTHIIPPFDRDALLIEVDLLPQWYAEFKLGKPLSADQRAEFEVIWNALIDRLELAEKTIVLRDFHSPNIIWREGKTGVGQIGLIDFQDAVMGPSAYDLASLAQDARVAVSPELETDLVRHYCTLRPEIDAEKFREEYAIMAAERATKVLGIFVRLSKRDGKHIYLNHLPRIEDYLLRALAHPVLANYRAWVKTNILNEMAD